MSERWSRFVLDAGMSRGGLACLCPVEGDFPDGDYTIVTGMNILTDETPSGGRVVAVIHEDGQDACDAWCEENADLLAKFRSHQVTNDKKPVVGEAIADGPPVGCRPHGNLHCTLCERDGQIIYWRARAEKSETRIRGLTEHLDALYEDAGLGVPCRMDLPSGPVCFCGMPSVHESGECMDHGGPSDTTGTEPTPRKEPP